MQPLCGLADTGNVLHVRSAMPTPPKPGAIAKPRTRHNNSPARASYYAVLHQLI